MLPARARLRSSRKFRETARRGARIGRPTLVVHATITHSPLGEPSPRSAATAQVGFVVSKAVGNAVTRNRVKRRLRHLVASRLDGVPSSAQIVVRALPAAASQPERLASDLDSAWAAAMNRLNHPGTREGE